MCLKFQIAPCNRKRHSPHLSASHPPAGQVCLHFSASAYCMSLQDAFHDCVVTSSWPVGPLLCPGIHSVRTVILDLMSTDSTIKRGGLVFCRVKSWMIGMSSFHPPGQLHGAINLFSDLFNPKHLGTECSLTLLKSLSVCEAFSGAGSSRTGRLSTY